MRPYVVLTHRKSFHYGEMRGLEEKLKSWIDGKTKLLVVPDWITVNLYWPPQGEIPEAVLSVPFYLMGVR